MLTTGSRSWTALGLAALGALALAAACSASQPAAPAASPTPARSSGTAAVSIPPRPEMTATPAPTAVQLPTSTIGPSTIVSLPTWPPTLTPVPSTTPTATPTLFPLSIAALRQRSYPGSDVKIESTLDPGVNYKRYIASYQSDGLTIYGLLTVPNGAPPAAGWPLIIFNHGFIPPQQYRTTSRYVAYQDWLARSGYITFKSDYRGHGSSQGVATGGYGSPDYVVDVLNALTSMERYPGVDARRVGMWGHSMGGYITLRAMVIRTDIKAAVIWSGVVASYPDLLYHWHTPPPNLPTRTPDPHATPGAERGWHALVDQFGPPETNPDFWNSISATSYLADLSGPLQLHHDLNDSEVPFQFSQTLYDEAVAAGQKDTEFYSYPGDDHNLANSFGLAMTRTIAFFDKYVKGS